MANAEVGDDVYGEDPTVKQLEERVAELLGTEAALFVPTGTMANQIALRAQTRPGDEVIIGDGRALLALRVGRARRARRRADAGRSAKTACSPPPTCAPRSRPTIRIMSPTRVVAVENTHNMAGGIVLGPRAARRGHRRPRTQLGMATHLDGARLWNAAVATGVDREGARARASTRSACACRRASARRPARSSRDARASSRRVTASARCTAAACARPASSPRPACYALEHHRARLGEDHANAQRARRGARRRAGPPRRPRAGPDEHRDDRSRARHRRARWSSSRAKRASCSAPPGAQARSARSLTSMSIATACCARRR